MKLETREEIDLWKQAIAGAVTQPFEIGQDFKSYDDWIAWCAVVADNAVEQFRKRMGGDDEDD